MGGGESTLPYFKGYYICLKHKMLQVMLYLLHLMIKGYDNFGLWVEHPNLYIVTSEDESGNPISKDGEDREHIDANIFIHWSNIRTLMHYPNRQGFDFPSEFDKDIGFKINEQR